MLAAGAAVVVAIVAVGAFLAVNQTPRRSRAAQAAAVGRARALVDGGDGAGGLAQTLMAAAVLAVGLAGSVVVTFVFGKVTQLWVVVSLDRPVDRFVDTHRIAGMSRLC